MASHERCPSPLPPLVMTTAINANSSYTKARDGAQRRQWAKAILQLWMSKSSLSVVVVDPTIKSERELDFLRGLGFPSRLELLAVPISKTPLLRGQTKGYLEYRSIAYASSASRLVRGCREFAHATGNRFISNAEQLLSNPAIRRCAVGVPKEGNAQVKSSSMARNPWVRWTSSTRPWLSSSFVVWTREFLLQYFNGEAITESNTYAADAAGNRTVLLEHSKPFEVELAKGVLRAQLARVPVAWFECVDVIGWSGSRQQAVRSRCPSRSAESVQVVWLHDNRLWINTSYYVDRK